MTTYREQIQSAVAGKVIPPFWLGYFREAFREEINDQLLELCSSGDLSKAELARKIGRRPEQVTRWMNAPSNLESDTVSDFAFAFGCRPRMSFEKIAFDQAATQKHAQTETNAENVVNLDAVRELRAASSSTYVMKLQDNG